MKGVEQNEIFKINNILCFTYNDLYVMRMPKQKRNNS